jgi:hypothetical protein
VYFNEQSSVESLAVTGRREPVNDLRELIPDLKGSVKQVGPEERDNIKLTFGHANIPAKYKYGNSRHQNANDYLDGLRLQLSEILSDLGYTLSGYSVTSPPTPRPGQHQIWIKRE